MKKFISLLLVVAMCLSLISTTAFATNTEGVEEITNSTFASTTINHNNTDLSIAQLDDNAFVVKIPASLVTADDTKRYAFDITSDKTTELSATLYYVAQFNNPEVEMTLNYLEQDGSNTPQYANNIAFSSSKTGICHSNLSSANLKGHTKGVGTEQDNDFYIIFVLDDASKLTEDTTVTVTGMVETLSIVEEDPGENACVVYKDEGLSDGEYEWMIATDRTEAFTFSHTFTAPKAPVAQIGEGQDVKTYTSLAAAVAAVPTDGTETTITMIADETITGNDGVTVGATQNIVLDLNGKTVKNAVNENKASQVIKNSGTLTIKDGSVAGNGVLTNAIQEGTQPGEWWSTPQYNYATNVITNNGTLTVKGGKIYETAASSICYAVDNNSSASDAIFNMEGGLVTKDSGTAVRMFCNSTTKVNTVNVSGGKIEAGYAAIWVQLPGSSAQKKLGTLNVTGGTLTGDYAFYDYSYGDLYDKVNYTLSGGTFDGNIFSYGANFSISGGTYNGEVAIKQAKASDVSVTGGKFADDVYTYGDNASTNFITGGLYKIITYVYQNETYGCSWKYGGEIAPDYEAVYNEDPDTKEAYPYTVAKKQVAKISDTIYPSLADALAAVPADNTKTVTIEMLADDVISSKLVINKKNVVINGNDHAIKASTDTKWESWDNFVDNSSAENVTFNHVIFDGNNLPVTCVSYGGKNTTYNDCKFINADNGHYYGAASGTLSFNHCVVDTKVYGINQSEGGATVIIKDCDIKGWNSFGDTETVSISGTSFDKSNYGMLRFYNDATVDKCTFTDEMDVDTCGSKAITVTFTGCSENLKNLFVLDEDTSTDSICEINSKKDSDSKYTEGIIVTKKAKETIALATNYKLKTLATNVYQVVPFDKVAIPVGQNFVWDGNSKTGVKTDEAYTLTGTASATNVDEYTATATLNSGYQWTDGTTAAKTITWEILKASQAAPAKGEGYTISETTLTATSGYELYNGTSTATSFTITAGKSYFVRKAEVQDQKYASPYTAIDTTVSVAAIASPASMGTVSISGEGVEGGKCTIGTSVTVTATAKSGYEFVEWRNAAGNKINDAGASYRFTANVSATLTAVFKVRDKVVATLPTVAPAKDRVYTGSPIPGVSGGTGCTLSGTTSAESVGTYTATATLTNTTEYIWPDGTTEPKTIVWSITPQTQAAPTGLTSNGELAIYGVKATMEYKLSTDAGYTPVPNSATSVEVDKPGTYYVRMKATTTALASKVTVVVVKEPTISAVTIQPANLETTSALFTGAAEPYSESRVTKVGFEYKKAVDNSWALPLTATKTETFSYNVTGLTEDTDYIVRAFVTYTTEGADDTTAYGKEIAFHTRKTPEPSVTLGKITAGATVEGNSAKKIIISVEEGNDVIASAISSNAIQQGESFEATFDNLPDGNYNVVVRTNNGDFTETRMITIENGAAVRTMFTIPVGKLATVVDVKTTETPKLAVEGLANMLKDEDKNDAAVGKKNVEIKLEAQKENIAAPVIETTQTAVEKIQAIIPPATSTVEEKIETVLDLSLIKTTTELENNEVKSVEVKDIGSENDKVIEVAVPYETAGKTLKVYRYHDGVAEELTLLSSRPSANFIDGTYFVGDGYVFIYASGFSTYAISYEETKTVTGGGGGGVTTYAITGADTVNGKLSVDKKTAASGSTVTITVTPDKGFTLETLTVTDKNGKEIEVKNLGNNKYSFKMPSSKVTVSATFVEAGTCPQDETCVYAKFTDADTKEWYHDGVHYCVENGMMNGVSNTQFAPSGTLTRGMVVTVLARLDGVTITSTGNEWYADGQKWAVANGISDGTNMTANITREQLATMLYRYAQFKGVDTNKFTENTNTLSHTDVFTISEWATSGMHFCIAAGVVGGDDNGMLNPHNNATRAEAATMFQRFCERIVK